MTDRSMYSVEARAACLATLESGRDYPELVDKCHAKNNGEGEHPVATATRHLFAYVDAVAEQGTQRTDWVALNTVLTCQLADREAMRAFLGE